METSDLTMNRCPQRRLPFAFLLGLATAMALGAAPYDPLKLPKETNTRSSDFSIHDGARNRTIPVRVYLPASTKPAPVVLFSHGLGGAKENNPYLGNHWAARGYVAVFLQHPGSDESVWKNAPAKERMTAMNRAASGQNFQLRMQDVKAALDGLTVWNQDSKHPLAGRLDLKRVGMSGHSFGAKTTQAVSGQTFPGAVGNRFTDQRIIAALAFSPSSPGRNSDPKAAFGKVAIPWMLMTGTNDEGIIGDADVASRLAVYPALPPGDKYELVLHEAEHSAFSERAMPGESSKRNPNHHRVILALSTAFWDAYLKQDAEAKAWLNGDGPRQVMEKEDRWQKK